MSEHEDRDYRDRVRDAIEEWARRQEAEAKRDAERDRRARANRTWRRYRGKRRK